MSYSNEEIKALIEEVEWQIEAVEKPSAINCNKMLEVIKQLKKVNNSGVLDSVSDIDPRKFYCHNNIGTIDKDMCNEQCDKCKKVTIK